jgi:23S rRNA pseudouridine2605 synthase
MSEEPIRLQKFLADAGVCSRRAAEVAIREGEVWVNGKRAELGQKVDPEVDRITFGSKQIKPQNQPRMTVVVHKPRGLICSNDDPHNPETVFSLLPRQLARYRFFCAGRLDKDSEGLVILTTDGDLAHRLMHPASEVVKRYAVRLEEPFPAAKMKLLLRGVVAEGETLKVEYANMLHPRMDGSSDSLDVHLHHGKKREIRLLFLALGYPVKRLRRYQIGALRLKGIPLRGVKLLSPMGIEQLFKTPSITNRRALSAKPKPHTTSEPVPEPRGGSAQHSPKGAPKKSAKPVKPAKPTFSAENDSDDNED